MTAVLSAFPLAAAWPFFILRLSIRCSRYRPPCDLLGRSASSRWLLPGYDRLFVVPVLALLLAAIGVGLSFSPLGGRLLTFVFAMAIALLAFFGPPDEETFRLTGHYRLPKPSGGHSEPSPSAPRTHFWD